MIVPCLCRFEWPRKIRVTSVGLRTQNCLEPRKKISIIFRKIFHYNNICISCIPLACLAFSIRGMGICGSMTVRRVLRLISKRSV